MNASFYNSHFQPRKRPAEDGFTSQAKRQAPEDKPNDRDRMDRMLIEGDVKKAECDISNAKARFSKATRDAACHVQKLMEAENKKFEIQAEILKLEKRSKDLKAKFAKLNEHVTFKVESDDFA